MRKYLSAFLVSLLVITGVGAALAATDSKGPGKVTAEELKSLLDAGNVVVIDSRGGKYLEGEIIKGAKSLPVDKQDAETLAKLVPSKDAKVVFYCTNLACNASELGGFKAISEGWTDVHKYPGGIEEWKEKGLPTEKL